MSKIVVRDIPSVLTGVRYETYLQLRDASGNRGYRMTYHDGTLEIISPELRHELMAERLGLIVRAVASACEIPYLGSRSTTFRRGRVGLPKGHGKEPDNSFYLANLEAIRGKDQVDLEDDPPPDLWIEVDHRSRSKGRLPLHASLGVPEVWRFRTRGPDLCFGRLIAGGYAPIDRSVALPILTPTIVLEQIARGSGLDDMSWDRLLRPWATQLADAGERPG